MNAGPAHLLNDLAALYGVQTSYYDCSRQRQRASTEVMLAVLRSLGAPVSGRETIPSAVRERRQALWRRATEPVLVCREGDDLTFDLRLPEAGSGARVAGMLDLESGETRQLAWRGADLPAASAAEIENTKYTVKTVSLPGTVPPGYHRLTVELPGRAVVSTVISAPERAYLPPETGLSHQWGAFLPLYSLRTERGWGAGDYSGLRAYADWLAGAGGRILPSLPLLPVFIDGVCEPSPYLPVSRRLWNEFYADPAGTPELERCEEALGIIQSDWFKARVESLRKTDLVDYHGVMGLKRSVMEALAGTCADNSHSDLSRFLRANPLVDEYAAFRAAGEKFNAPWRNWTSPQREGTLSPADYDAKVKQYYVYAQYLAHRQVDGAASHARAQGMTFYQDLPLGIHPDGFDAWKEPGLFLSGLRAGAPPDPVFPTGQNWSFPPLHPERSREEGHRYTIEYIRHHLAHAGMLRIDHVMSLHRLFVIPEGLEPSHGVYIRYPADELYAIYALESHRHKTVIVGEDLGLVPREVKSAMTRHGFRRMYTLYFEMATGPGGAPRVPPRDSIASVNTHDMPPFAAWWRGMDIDWWLRLGLMSKEKAADEHLARQTQRDILTRFLEEQELKAGDDASALRSCLEFLSASPAGVVLVNLEDLWLETGPQNIPGTGDQYPNWRRKAAYTLESFREMPEVTRLLSMVARIRKKQEEWSHRENLLPGR